MMSRYDIDNSGAIDREEMVNVMKAIYSMVDGNVSEAIRGSTMEKVIVGPICQSSIEFYGRLCRMQRGSSWCQTLTAMGS